MPAVLVFCHTIYFVLWYIGACDVVGSPKTKEAASKTADSSVDSVERSGKLCSAPSILSSIYFRLTSVVFVIIAVLHL